ncbi:hypothetical protein L2Y96_17295 [Luteibacter aegosomaticola]|uniref:hypothetical protein n=1 Tax=Luteibacter aegosomaticola TaxID=2911538 RepID=UPI001FFA0A5A|nr:hypothetical protein [Luteibacter aegosomaticola]UPG89138.1 hypothetical protein L2Y96_17295 [Luteibacter aegosomaticola]
MDLRLLRLAAVTLLATGCCSQVAQKKAPKPTHFRHHVFSAECGYTRSCKVIYANRVQVDEPEGGKVWPLKEGVIKAAKSGQIAIRNFPEPALVTWQSMDGERHEDRVDMSSIFKRRVVVHAEPVDEVDDDGAVGDPTLLLVVEDRSVRVYMQSMVFLRRREGQGEDGILRHDSVLVYSKSY